MPAEDGSGGGLDRFDHDGFQISYLDRAPSQGDRNETILLIHGFASSLHVNWVSPGWVKTLTDAGYRVVALDNRGHGRSSVSYDPDDYAPEEMAGDAAALLAHLGIERAHVMGYSMGARIAAFLALAEPETVASLVFGGLGIGMVTGVGDWDPIATALRTDDPTSIVSARARSFRAFADQTRSDRQALAACIQTSRTLLSRSDIGRILQPTLVAVGSNDDIGGSADELAALMPNATAFTIEGRDHMLAVGDRTFKARVLEFLADNPL